MDDERTKAKAVLATLLLAAVGLLGAMWYFPEKPARRRAS
jgi:hypothetical protein